MMANLFVPEAKIIYLFQMVLEDDASPSNNTSSFITIWTNMNKKKQMNMIPCELLNIDSVTEQEIIRTVKAAKSQFLL